MRVLAIDPALRNTGYAVIEQLHPPAGKRGPVKYRALAYGTIKNATKLRPSGCLVQIRQRIADIIAEHQPGGPHQPLRVLGVDRRERVLVVQRAARHIHAAQPRDVGRRARPDPQVMTRGAQRAHDMSP